VAVASPSVVACLARLDDAVATDWRVVAAAVSLPGTVFGAVAGRCAVEIAVVALLGVLGDAVSAAALNPRAVCSTGAPGHAVVGAIVTFFSGGVVHDVVTAAADDFAVGGTSAVWHAVQGS
jgi:hypothetical protein